MKTARGFTLIELMIVVVILALLMGMVMPMVKLAQRAANRSATQSVMHKVDTALRLFKNEMGAYPYQRTYADIAGGEQWTNRLYYHLATEIDPADVVKLQADAAAAAACYAYDCTRPGGGVRENPPASPQAFRRADIQPTWQWNSFTHAWDAFLDTGFNPNRALATAVIVNRMAQERARLAVFAGNVDIAGVHMGDQLTPAGVVHAVGRDLSAVKLLPAPLSGGNPGWADDYLHGELEARYRRGEAILDAYGQPLIYVSQITEGTRSVRSYLFGSGVGRFDVAQYGLQRCGRKSLSPIDPVTGRATLADPPALPDAHDLLHSDRRLYAAPGFEVDVELWSAGPDRKFAWMRDESCNQDNVPLLPYDKGIGKDIR